MNKFSIIIPCFNSEKFIRKNLILLISKVRKLKILYEIIIINDGSNDNTLSEIYKIKNKHLRIINLKKNYGKSFAVRKGIKLAKLNNIILLDCDLPYFNKFELIVKKLNENIDFVTIDRKSKKSKILNEKTNIYAYFRLFLGNIIGYIVNFFLKLDKRSIDTQAGLKGFKNLRQIRKKKFISKKFFLDLEIIFLFIKMKKVFFYVNVNYRVNNVSTINLFSINSIRILVELIKVIIHLKKI